ncbi:hypothetical protein OA07_11945 [Aphanizomenon flos-aquae 2012/KM1/D3]|nr:hypothetical protein OA07_11945 [Aphanizomenon flos-aquae 2012/KM1/D3]
MKLLLDTQILMLSCGGIAIQSVFLKAQYTYKRREQGTLNWEQIRNTHLHKFKAQSKKGCF